MSNFNMYFMQNRTTFMERLSERLTAIEAVLKKLEPVEGLNGKKVALFGSYGWGDGQWMRDWEKDCDDAGINLVCESVICCETPDDAVLEACRAMGKVLAE